METGHKLSPVTYGTETKQYEKDIQYIVDSVMCCFVSHLQAQHLLTWDGVE
jgi:hypothetical protein